MKLKYTIKQVTEKEVELDIQFPIFLKEGNTFHKIEQDNKSSIYPYRSTRVTLYETGGVSMMGESLNDKELASIYSNSVLCHPIEFQNAIESAIEKLQSQSISKSVAA